MKIIKLKESDLINAVRNVLNEQQSGAGCEYKDWKNGDGIKKPKITVQQSENGVYATYIGPETGFCIQHSKGSTTDTLHQLAGVVRVVVSGYLKTLYKQGIFVKPSLNDIDMQKDNNFFKISVPFVKTTEDKAITNFNERGEWGGNASDTIKAFLSTIKNDRYGLINTVTKVASGGRSADITEHWVSFRDLEAFPIQTKTEERPQPPIKQQEPAQQPSAQTQQAPPAQAQQPAATQQQSQDIATLIGLTENDSSNLRIISPLPAGKYVELYDGEKRYGCTWKNTNPEAYEDKNMFLQLSKSGGKLRAIIVTGDGDMIEMRTDGMNCKVLK